MSDFDSNQQFTPSIDNSQSLREYKKPEIRYVSYKLINEMYTMLIYSGDLTFAIKSSELMYSTLYVNDQDFVNWCAGYYYMNRYNMLYNELIESTFNSYKKIGQGFVGVDGKVFRCGTNYRRDV